jgi:hypothetical protein
VIDLRPRVALVIAEFDRYVQAYDDAVPFTRAGQYELHRRTIDRRRAFGSAAGAVMDDVFTADLHVTLRGWGIGQLASPLVPLELFRTRLRERADLFIEFDGRSLEDVPTDEVGQLTASLDRLIANLGIVENKARIVAGTKTLHHILPDLVPPMDRAWTGAFFGWKLLDPSTQSDPDPHRSRPSLRTDRPRRTSLASHRSGLAYLIPQDHRQRPHRVLQDQPNRRPAMISTTQRQPPRTCRSAFLRSGWRAVFGDGVRCRLQRRVGLSRLRSTREHAPRAHGPVGGALARPRGRHGPIRVVYLAFSKNSASRLARKGGCDADHHHERRAGL